MLTVCLETVALPSGFDLSPAHQDLLRAMDVLDEHSEQLSTKLALLMRPLKDQDLSVFFMTSPPWKLPV